MDVRSERTERGGPTNARCAALLSALQLRLLQLRLLSLKGHPLSPMLMYMRYEFPPKDTSKCLHICRCIHLNASLPCF